MSALPHRNVLLIDDNSSDRELVHYSLKHDRTCRYQFYEAAVGSEALAFLQSNQVSLELVILDWHLPDMTGLELVHKIRGNAQIPPFPIVMLTSTASTSFSNEAMEAGVQDFFTKSMITAEIMPLIARNAIERFRLMQRLVDSEKESREAKLRADDANRTKSMFLASMSHELRTPLTAVIGLSEILLDNPTADDAHHMLDMILTNGKHLGDLLNDILDIAKIEAGHLHINCVQCEPLKLIAELCDLLRYRAVDEGIELQLTLDGVLPGKIKTDPVRMRQILMNLLTNAIKFTNEGKIDVTVSLEETDGQQFLKITVADTGIGIAEENRELIFHPFVQVLDRPSKQSGVGLGLAISRSLARSLGGDLQVQSQVNRGSIFTLTLLMDDASELKSHHQYLQQIKPKKRKSLHPEITLDWAKYRVLVAEDTPANQFLIRRMLENTGLKMNFVENGIDAVDEILCTCQSNTPYDLILMDMQMPIQSGYDATRAIRDAGITIPVVALTAAAMEGDRDRCIKAGCTNYLSKPIRRDELLKIISESLLALQKFDAPARFSQQANFKHAN